MQFHRMQHASQQLSCAAVSGQANFVPHKIDPRAPPPPPAVPQSTGKFDGALHPAGPRSCTWPTTTSVSGPAGLGAVSCACQEVFTAQYAANLQAGCAVQQPRPAQRPISSGSCRSEHRCPRLPATLPLASFPGPAVQSCLLVHHCTAGMMLGMPAAACLTCPAIPAGLSAVPVNLQLHSQTAPSAGRASVTPT